MNTFSRRAIFVFMVLIIFIANGTAAASVSPKILPNIKLKAPVMKPTTFEGVWELSKILIQSKYKTKYGFFDEEPLTIDRHGYLVFVGKTWCASKTVLESEVLCENGYKPFNGRTVGVPEGYKSAVKLQRGTLELSYLSGKGGGLVRYLYTKTKLKPESKNKKGGDTVLRKNAGAVIANFPVWKKKMEEEGTAFGATFSPEPKLNYGDVPMERFYVELHQWISRSRDALEKKEYRKAHQAAMKAKEAYLTFMERAPEWKRVYQIKPIHPSP